MRPGTLPPVVRIPSESKNTGNPLAKRAAVSPQIADATSTSASVFGSVLPGFHASFGSAW